MIHDLVLHCVHCAELLLHSYSCIYTYVIREQRNIDTKYNVEVKNRFGILHVDGKHP